MSPLRGPHHLVRAGRIEAQVRVSGRVLEPTGVGEPTPKRAGASADYLRIPPAYRKRALPAQPTVSSDDASPCLLVSTANFWGLAAAAIAGSDAAVCPCRPDSAHPGHESASSRAHGAVSWRSRSGPHSCAVPGRQPAGGRPRCTSVPPVVL